MPVQDPQQLHQVWEKAYNDRDVDALVELYEPDATLFPQPGSGVTGQDAIRQALALFVALGGQILMQTAGVIENGDLAVVYGDWTLTGGTDSEGNPVNLESRSTDVMRRQSDGSWLDAIDDPYSSG